MDVEPEPAQFFQGVQSRVPASGHVGDQVDAERDVFRAGEPLNNNPRQGSETTDDRAAEKKLPRVVVMIVGHWIKTETSGFEREGNRKTYETVSQ